MTTRSRSLGARRGGVLIILAISLTVLIAVLALGTDGGRIYEERRKVQAAADAAALAGAVAWFNYIVDNPSGNASATATTAALQSASDNGYNNDTTNNTVTVNIPPSSGSFTSATDAIEVIIQSNLKGTFGKVITQQDLAVKSRGVARCRSRRTGVLALKGTGTAVSANGGGTLTVQKGSVYINSSSSSALTGGGSGSMTAVSFNMVGSYQTNNSFQVVGTVKTGSSSLADPYATMPAPTLAAYTTRSNSALTINSVTTLSPGVYTGGISIQGGGVVTLNPGVYILNGGGLTMRSSASLTGSGVVFYNTAGSGAGPIDIGSSGVVSLSPPTAGAYAGISIFQDPSVTQTVSLSGGSNITLSGAVYAPSAPVSVSGNASVGASLYGAFICSSIDFSGGGNVSIDVSRTAGARDIRLLE